MGVFLGAENNLDKKAFMLMKFGEKSGRSYVCQSIDSLMDFEKLISLDYGLDILSKTKDAVSAGVISCRKY